MPCSCTPYRSCAAPHRIAPIPRTFTTRHASRLNAQQKDTHFLIHTNRRPRIPRTKSDTEKMRATGRGNGGQAAGLQMREVGSGGGVRRSNLRSGVAYIHTAAHTHLHAGTPDPTSEFPP